MKKKFLAVAIASVLAMSSLVGCGGNTAKADLNVGMVTDSGTIDDKSFNQGTWEGIKQAEKDLGVSTNYLKPALTTEADYLKEIANLYDTDFKFIVTPGYKFESAIFQAQDKYQDAKFVLIDGSPNNGKAFDDPEFQAKVGPNTVSIFYAEHEAGFLAGIAASLEQKEGEMGFIGGMEIPPVQKFNWGFQQGVKYANDNLGTTIEMKPENIVYQGTFDNAPAGKQLAASMYDKGVKTIFCAAGGVGAGAITEAKERATAGKEAWIVGVDVDQYAEGIYEGEKSVIRTSAVKKIATSAFDMIQAELKGEFPGGQTLMFDSKNDGVGIPAENPNLSEATVKTVNDVAAKIKAGEIKVAGENDGSLAK
ncbi:MAG: BMP family lipoprotein [Cellulosilyticaceae bacterium]